MTDFDNVTLTEEFLNLDFGISEESARSILTSFTNTFAYQGYNPAEFLIYLKKLAQSKGITATDFKKDMWVFISFYVERGSNMVREKTAQRSSPEAIREIRRLQTLYKVSGDNPRGKHDVTVARIIGCFPQLVAKALSLGYGRIVGRVPNGMKPYLCFPGAPALFGSSKASQKLYRLWLVWALSFDATINSIPKPESTHAYGRIAFGSPVLSDEQRSAAIEALSKTKFQRNLIFTPMTEEEFAKWEVIADELLQLQNPQAVPTYGKSTAGPTMDRQRRKTRYTSEDNKVRREEGYPSYSTEKGDEEEI